MTYREKVMRKSLLKDLATLAFIWIEQKSSTASPGRQLDCNIIQASASGKEKIDEDVLRATITRLKKLETNGLEARQNKTYYSLLCSHIMCTAK